MKLSEIIRAAAARMTTVKIEVDEQHETVAIGADIFLQGDDAAGFITQSRELWNEAGDVSLEECYACVAEPYSDL